MHNSKLTTEHFLKGVVASAIIANLISYGLGFSLFSHNFLKNISFLSSEKMYFTEFVYVFLYFMWITWSLFYLPFICIVIVTLPIFLSLIKYGLVKYWPLTVIPVFFLLSFITLGDVTYFDYSLLFFVCFASSIFRLILWLPAKPFKILSRTYLIIFIFSFVAIYLYPKLDTYIKNIAPIECKNSNKLCAH